MKMFGKASRARFLRSPGRFKCFALPPMVAVLCGVLYLNLVNFTLCNDIEARENTTKYSNDSLLESCDIFNDSPDLVWSHYLEDYVLSQSSRNRTSKDLPYLGEMSSPDVPTYPMMNFNTGPQQSAQPPLNYHSSVYSRPGVFVTRRIGEAIELEPHMRPPAKVVNPPYRPMTNQMIHQRQPGFFQQLFGIGGGSTASTVIPPHSPQTQQQYRPPPPPVPVQQHLIPQQPGHVPSKFRAVTENELYLLGAIEKLVYRVDYLESRIRRAEQLIYYLMAGNNQKEVRDPCPTNFTRIGDNCYYINGYRQVNWKTANTACKSLNAHLAEFEKASENEDIIAYLLNQPHHRGRDFWLGGLNPGLLWIWSNSAKPVNPNTNLTSIAMSHKEATKISDTEANTIDNEDKKETGEDKDDDETVLNNTVEIKGQGRCLRLSYNPNKHTYAYSGEECTSRHLYICEYEDRTLDNKIKKIARELQLID